MFGILYTVFSGIDDSNTGNLGQIFCVRFYNRETEFKVWLFNVFFNKVSIIIILYRPLDNNQYLLSI